MVRILYAGYLAFALYFLYPMVHDTLTLGMVCIGSALPGGASGLSTPAANGLGRHAGRCGPAARTGVSTGRMPGIH
ncbi:hypothetical protein GQ56_0110505 [Burkholderia paludis]|uniref:hypothetical protein n=1 Tax=Burkholderia paludis TaxID=1506587 RepID=UPI0004DB6A85|nr:hypothetical protein [Burkholderia paludis]KFG97271.1 hypothetical protein GQ56_0110505 [Burkholderia paludis]